MKYTNTNAKWNSAYSQRKDKSEKPATFSLFSFLSQQAKFHLAFVFVIHLLIRIYMIVYDSRLDEVIIPTKTE